VTKLLEFDRSERLEQWAATFAAYAGYIMVTPEYNHSTSGVLVAGSHDEIVQARQDWIDGDRFAPIVDAGAPLPAPPLPPGHLRARGATR
jgi:hypothetical protein